MSRPTLISSRKRPLAQALRKWAVAVVVGMTAVPPASLGVLPAVPPASAEVLPAVPSASAEVLPAVPSASAGVLHTTFPFVGTFVSPCTGELIAFTGALQVLVGQLTDGSGALELTLYSNFQGITGTGVMTGTPYQIPASSEQIMSVGLPPVTVTQANDFHVVGGHDNFMGQLPLTVTISTTGGVSASVGPLQFVCN